MMKMLKRSLLLALALVPSLAPAQAQQPFQNLDFESPILPLSVSDNGWLTAQNAIPGWTPYIGDIARSDVVYDAIGLGSAMISFHDNHSMNKPIQGSFSVFLQSSTGGPQDSVGIGQVGTIPSDAKSLQFWSGTLVEVTFAGSLLPTFYLKPGTSQYAIIGADISAFAGQTGEIRFTLPYSDAIPPRTMSWLDNIQFSTEAVPEPSTLAILSLGGLALIWHRRR